jgi:NAD(P)-dependent dehydrogenase (short-subunit alcohol dehydrogenase family)
MSGRLAGQVALVTGAGSGIGRAVVDRYVAEGARVGALVRRPDVAATLQAELGGAVAVSVGDVRSEADLRNAVDETVGAFGRLDTVVANAGLWDYGRRLEEFEAEALAPAFTELYAVNVLGVLLTARVAVEPLSQTAGSIIVTGSPSGRHAGGGGPLYVGSKHAV